MTSVTPAPNRKASWNSERHPISAPWSRGRRPIPVPEPEGPIITPGASEPAPADHTARPGAFASLRVRSFLFGWSALVVASIGMWMQNLAIPYVAYQLTDSTIWLSVTVAATFVPAFLTSPWAGALCDRYSPRRVMLLSAVLQTSMVTGLAVCWAAGLHDMKVLLAFVIPFHLGGGLIVVAWYTMVPRLVGPRILPGAIRLVSLQNTLARALGPTFAGVVLTRWGPGASFTGTAVAYSVLVLVTATLPATAAAAGRTMSVLGDLRDGLRYAWANQVPRHAILTITAFAVCAYSVIQLAPVIAESLLHVGADGYSQLLVAYGVGALIGTAMLAVGGERIPRSTSILLGLVGGVAGTAGIGLITNPTVALVAFGAVGWAQTTVSVSQNTAIIVLADERFRGRVVSLYLMAILGTLPVGTFVLGMLMDRLPIGRVIVAAAALLAVYAVVSSVRSDRFRIFDGVG